MCLETCVPQIKTDKINSSILRKKNDEVKQEQPDSSNVVIDISEDTKNIASDTSNSDVTDLNEAEAKEIDANELNEAEGVDIIIFNKNETKIDYHESNQENTNELEKDETLVTPINSKDIDILIKEIKSNKIKPESLDDLDIEGDEIKEEFIKINENIEEKKDIIKNSIIIDVKEIVDDEDNIQDEELDHEVDEEEIKGSTDFTNDTVSFKFNFIQLL